ncbi:MAG: rhomboid family intramembrane serine protease [Desulfohalobiaceae bacterium]|nr:rhomboid family intramembrane serine protease [Desulfohalobiaceae bacterium]
MDPHRVDIIPRVARSRVRPAVSRDRAELWSLVLLARGIPHSVERQDRVWRIEVDPEQAEEAVQEIEAFEGENEEPETGESAAPAASGGVEATFWVMLALMIFYKLTTMDLAGFGYQSIPWKELGSVNVWKVHQGEWWRLITGLTLHGDPTHLLSNVAAGSVFLVFLIRELGPGTAWSATLAAGIGGNWLNCLVQDYSHSALGFSTSVFGAVGILAGLRALEGSGQRGPLDRLVPVGAGLGLLAMLGTGGGNIDVASHVFGFASGVVLGLGLGSVGRMALPPPRGADLWTGGLGLALVVISWHMALTSSSIS